MNFQYWAKAGNGKSVRGKRSAENEEELLEWIRDKGWIPINIARSYETVASIGDSFGKKIDWKEFFDLSPKVKLRDKAIFIRQLYISRGRHRRGFAIYRTDRPEASQACQEDIYTR